MRIPPGPPIYGQRFSRNTISRSPYFSGQKYNSPRFNGVIRLGERQPADLLGPNAPGKSIEKLALIGHRCRTGATGPTDTAIVASEPTPLLVPVDPLRSPENRQISEDLATLTMQKIRDGQLVEALLANCQQSMASDIRYLVAKALLSKCEQIIADETRLGTVERPEHIKIALDLAFLIFRDNAYSQPEDVRRAIEAKKAVLAIIHPAATAEAAPTLGQGDPPPVDHVVREAANNLLTRIQRGEKESALQHQCDRIDAGIRYEVGHALLQLARQNIREDGCAINPDHINLALDTVLYLFRGHRKTKEDDMQAVYDAKGNLQEAKAKAGIKDPLIAAGRQAAQTIFDLIKTVPQNGEAIQAAIKNLESDALRHEMAVNLLSLCETKISEQLIQLMQEEVQPTKPARPPLKLVGADTEGIPEKAPVDMFTVIDVALLQVLTVFSKSGTPEQKSRLSSAIISLKSLQREITHSGANHFIY